MEIGPRRDERSRSNVLAQEVEILADLLEYLVAIGVREKPRLQNLRNLVFVARVQL